MTHHYQQQQGGKTATGDVTATAAADEEFKMSSAELRYEAPLATFDGDEWNEFMTDGGGMTTTNIGVTDAEGNIEEGVTLRDAHDVLVTTREETVDNFCETFSGSLEDLVNTFDAKVTKCFRNYNEQAEQIAPVQIRTQDELIADSQTWWTITGQLGSDWCKAYTLPTAALYDIGSSSHNMKRSKSTDTSSSDDDDDDDVDDDDSEAEYDVTSYPYDVTAGGDEEQEPLLTADEVISEIECMMEGSPMTSERPWIGYRRSTLATVRPEMFRFTADINNGNFQLHHDDSGGLDCLSVTALSELADELQRCVHEYSEELVSELARRDELDFEKELKNQFIWLLLRVQKRHRDEQMTVRSTLLHRIKSTSQTYLNTVIPYEPSRGAPSVDKLQIYIKILSAINEDSSAVPSLLTDYILNVLCPTSM
jgi:hypothetical protein